MMDSANDLLSDDERADLDGVTAGSSPEARAVAEEAYVQGRVAGLCREGALELAADAIGDVARAVSGGATSAAG